MNRKHSGLEVTALHCQVKVARFLFTKIETISGKGSLHPSILSNWLLIARTLSWSLINCRVSQTGRVADWDVVDAGCEGRLFQVGTSSHLCGPRTRQQPPGLWVFWAPGRGWVIIRYRHHQPVTHYILRWWRVNSCTINSHIRVMWWDCEAFLIYIN